jgi:cell division protein FtsB
MRLRRRTRHNFTSLILPAIAVAVIGYFGYAGVAGPRGIVARNDAQAELAVRQSELARLRGERRALEHRISLLDARALDPDMLDELARSTLSQSRTGEVTVSRRSRP